MGVYFGFLSIHSGMLNEIHHHLFKVPLFIYARPWNSRTKTGLMDSSFAPHSSPLGKCTGLTSLCRLTFKDLIPLGDWGMEGANKKRSTPSDFSAWITDTSTTRDSFTVHWGSGVFFREKGRLHLKKLWGKWGLTHWGFNSLFFQIVVELASCSSCSFKHSHIVSIAHTAAGTGVLLCQ